MADKRHRLKQITTLEHAKCMAVARSDLNTLYAVIAVLEGGTISADHQGDVSRIIRICQNGAQKALERYDDHADAIARLTNGEVSHDQRGCGV